MKTTGHNYWIIILFIFCLIPVLSYGQPSNYTCATATAITIPPAGNICVNGTNLNSVNDGTYNTCDALPGGNQVWYTYVTTGSQNTITVTPPGGAGSAQQVVVTITDQGCGSGTYIQCNASPTSNGTASVNWAFPIGTQIIIQVTTNGTDGNFQLCITSVTPPPTPGETCGSATLLCDKSTLTVNSTSSFTPSGYIPSCFFFTGQQDLWYKFTVGQTGTLEFEGTPLGLAEFDWALFNITSGCPGTEVACNYNFTDHSGFAFGIGPSSCIVCPTGGSIQNACSEHCNTITVTAGNTYVLMVDNFSANGTGFTLSWGGTFLMAPTANFTVAPSSNCGSLSACFTNTSVTATSWNWDFANGNTSTLQNPACQNYTTPGVYMVSLIVTSASGCTDVASGTVTVAQNPTVSMSQTDVGCFGTCTGQATVTATGGTPAYTYLWSGGGASSTKTGLCQGTYTVTVTTSTGCTATSNVNITQPATGMTLSLSSTNESCPTSCDGSATATVSGGSPNYTYSWSGGGTGSVKSPVCDGTYTVTVTDSKSCTATQSVSVSQPAAMSLGTTSVNANCGKNDGSASVTVTGGTSPFTYLWSDGGATSTITALYSGSYFVTVTDNKGCTSTSMASVNNIPGGTATASTTGNATCNGSCNGTAVVSMTGGTASFTYLWNNGEASSNATALCSGTYTVTVTDAKGCTSASSGAITQPTAISLSSSTTPSNCTANDGTASITASGGTSPYTYGWSSGGSNSTDTALFAGTYSVTVSDSKGCSAIITAAVGTVSGGSVSATTTGNVSCYGLCDGTAQATLTGGTPPFTFLWSNGETDSAATLLCNGAYSVTVTDGKGCTATAPGSITEPAALGLTFTSVPATCTDSSGSISANVTGGVQPYSYQWLPSGPNNPIITGIPAGLYGIIVTDVNGCMIADSVFLNSTGSVVVTISTFTNVSCYDSSDGTATATVTGTSPPYTYAWSSGDSQSLATGLQVGAYGVSVTDASGCMTSASVTITEPQILLAVGIRSLPTCFGYTNGTIDMTVTGGTPSYSYLWSDNSLNEDLTAGAGIYTVTVTDANGCTALYSDTITEPAAIVLALTSTDASCGLSDGSVAVSPSYGVGTYSYYWLPGGATSDIVNGLATGFYNVTVTDANGCTAVDGVAINNIGGPAIGITSITPVSCFGGSDGTVTINTTGGTDPLTYTWSTVPTQNTTTATGLSAGTYTITVTDALTCTTSQDVIITEPNAINATGYGATMLCNGQSATIGVTVTGGTTPYSYTWDYGIPDVDVYTVSPDTTTTYTVIVLDANGCSAPAQPITVSLPQPLQVSVSGNDIICENQSTVLTANGSGGNNGPYTYQWSSGETGNLITVSPVSSTAYTVTVTDNCGSTPASDDLQVTVQPMLNLNPPSATGCPGQTFTLTASGAITYWWSTAEEPAETIGIGTTVVVNPMTTTYYLVHGYDGICAGVDTVPVIITQPPDADFTVVPDTTTLLFPDVLFTDASTADAVWWGWDFGDGDEDSLVQVIVHTYNDTGTYLVTLNVKNIEGCPDLITKILRINPEFMLFMPSAFTPNKDGKNDELLPIHTGIDRNTYRFTIFDRWGDLIWETTDPDKSWDGRANNGRNKTQQDVYVWTIETKDLNKKIHYFVGHVTVVK